MHETHLHLHLARGQELQRAAATAAVVRAVRDARRAERRERSADRMAAAAARLDGGRRDGAARAGRA